MKKILSAFMCAALIAVSAFAFAGCSKADQASYQIVMITDGGTVTDGSYNQSAWQGVKSFAEKSGSSYRYYQPKVSDGETLSTENAEQYIDLAVKKGAEYIVLPTDVFEVAVYDKAPLYSNVKFILADGTPHAQDDDTDAISKMLCVFRLTAFKAASLQAMKLLWPATQSLAISALLNQKHLLFTAQALFRVRSMPQISSVCP